MPLPRLLLLCIFGLACAASAAAQSPGVNQSPSQPYSSAPLHVPALTHIPALVESASETAQSTQLYLASLLQKPFTLAQNDRPCYAMRSYGFSADDLKSSAPTPSSYSTCAAPSSVRRKDAENVTVK